jgi:hypothetical protein
MGVIVLAAIMMHVGARLKNEDLEHVRSIYPGIGKLAGFIMPICERGFRKPGAVQFLAAPDNYIDGRPRSFNEPW